MTNGDRIRQMSNEELAKFIELFDGYCEYCCLKYINSNEETRLCDGKCEEGIKAYLESEVER